MPILTICRRPLPSSTTRWQHPLASIGVKNIVLKHFPTIEPSKPGIFCNKWIFSVGDFKVILQRILSWKHEQTMLSSSEVHIHNYFWYWDHFCLVFTHLMCTYGNSKTMSHWTQKCWVINAKQTFRNMQDWRTRQVKSCSVRQILRKFNIAWIGCHRQAWLKRAFGPVKPYWISKSLMLKLLTSARLTSRIYYWHCRVPTALVISN